MGSFSDFLENEILDHIMGVGSWTSPATVYVGLSTADPLDTGGNLAEPSGNGYIRKAISFGSAGSRAITQDAIVNFNEATGSWGTVTHWALFNAESAGNMLAHGQLSTSRSIVSGNTPSIASGQVVVSVSTGGMSTYLANAMLDHCFNSTTYTQPSIYVGLAETAMSDATTGSTVDELEMTGYAREAKTSGGTDWGTASGGATSNSTLIDFGALTGTSETVEAAFIADNLSTGAGNILFYDNSPSQVIGDGDTVQFPIGDFDISIS